MAIYNEEADKRTPNLPHRCLHLSTEKDKHTSPYPGLMILTHSVPVKPVTFLYCDLYYSSSSSELLAGTSCRPNEKLVNIILFTITLFSVFCGARTCYNCISNITATSHKQIHTHRTSWAVQKKLPSLFGFPEDVYFFCNQSIISIRNGLWKILEVSSKIS